MRTVAFYISGHGLGHASRAITVINALLARSPDVRVIARTSAAAWLFERSVGPASPGPVEPSALAGMSPDRFQRIETLTDTGAIQLDSLHLDEAATVVRAREFMRTFAARVTAEADFLRAHGASVVVADIPALGIAAARAVGVPALGLGNFTWDWIYAAYHGADDVVHAIGDAYRSAQFAMRLPMHGGFDTFRRIIDIPFVARCSTRHPDDTKRALGLPRDKRLVLLSFGGYGLDRIDQHALASLAGTVVVGSVQHPLDEAAMYGAGFRYEDLIRAVDVVVSKPGYGIISECIANDTALLYTSRGRFIEYDVFVHEMPSLVRARFISHADLFAGRWQDDLDALLAQRAPGERPALNGAQVAAELIENACG